MEDWDFRALMYTTTPVMPKLLPMDGDAIRYWILGKFKEKQEELITVLQVSKRQVHFSFDLWTSPHYRSKLGLVGHYLKYHTSLGSLSIDWSTLRHQHG